MSLWFKQIIFCSILTAHDLNIIKWYITAKPGSNNFNSFCVNKSIHMQMLLVILFCDYMYGDYIYKDRAFILSVSDPMTTWLSSKTNSI